MLTFKQLSGKLEIWRLTAGSLRAKIAFRRSVRASFYRHLIAQTSNDVQILDSLRSYRPRLQRRKQRDALQILDSVITSMQNGFTLDAALKPWVPSSEYGVLVSGVAANAIASSLTQLLVTQERTQTLLNQIRMAFTLPIGNLCVVFGFMWFLGKSVLPLFESLVPKANADGMIRGLYALGNFATSWALPATLLGLLAIFGLVLWSLPRWCGVTRIAAERFFPWNYYRDVQGFLWLTGYAALLAAGTQELVALGTQLTAATPWLGERLRAIRARMQGGLLLPSALKAATPEGSYGRISFNFPNQDVIDDIGSLHGFEDFPQRIEKVADQWARDLSKRTELLTKVMGLIANLMVYGLIIYIIYASNDLQYALAATMNTAPH